MSIGLEKKGLGGFCSFFEDDGGNERILIRFRGGRECERCSDNQFPCDRSEMNCRTNSRLMVAAVHAS